MYPGTWIDGTPTLIPITRDPTLMPVEPRGCAVLLPGQGNEQFAPQKSGVHGGDRSLHVLHTLGEFVQAEYLDERIGTASHAFKIGAHGLQKFRGHIRSLVQAPSGLIEQDRVIIRPVNKHWARRYGDLTLRVGQRGCGRNDGEHHPGAFARDAATRPQDSRLVRRTTQDVGMAQRVEGSVEEGQCGTVRCDGPAPFRQAVIGGACESNSKGHERKGHQDYVATRKVREIQSRPSRPGAYVE